MRIGRRWSGHDTGVTEQAKVLRNGQMMPAMTLKILLCPLE